LAQRDASDCGILQNNARNDAEAYNRMMETATTVEKVAATPVQRLYLRPDQAAAAIGVSRRTLSDWQVRRVIPFRRVGRTVLFAIADIQQALDRFKVAAVGDPPPPRKPSMGRLPRAAAQT